MRILVACFALAIIFAAPMAHRTIAAVAVSQSSPQHDQSTSFTLEGKINSLSAGKITVSTEDNMIFHVTYDDATKIYRKDGASGSAKDLVTGEKISVQGDLTPAGVIKAHRINIE